MPPHPDAGGLKLDWLPNRGGLLLELDALKSGGSSIFRQRVGQIPGLRGRLNPILDSLDRTYLYADNIAINEGQQQPVHFRLGQQMRLTDSSGVDILVAIVDIRGQSSLVEYRLLEEAKK